MNYNLQMEQELLKIEPGTQLLLHACCAPCASGVILRLCNFFALTVFFYNPNIDSKEEYEKRADAMQSLLLQMPKAQFKINAIYEKYSHSPFLEAAKNLEEEPEGQARCRQCFALRLDKTAKTASQMGILWACTTLSVSPHKNPQTINTIGQNSAEKHGIHFLSADFKKKDGYGQSVKL